MRPLLYLLLCAWLLWIKPIATTPWRLEDAFDTRKACHLALKESSLPAKRCLPQGTYPEL